MKKKITYDDIENLRLSLYSKSFSDIEKKDIYKKYLKLLRQLAYNGDAEAQFALGVHYEGSNYWDDTP